jgi:hypothetical protein
MIGVKHALGVRKTRECQKNNCEETFDSRDDSHE